MALSSPSSRWLQIEGALPGGARLEVELVGVESLQEIELDIHQSTLRLLAPNYSELRLPLPPGLDIDRSKAKFSKKKAILTVDLPRGTEEAPAARPETTGHTSPAVAATAREVQSDSAAYAATSSSPTRADQHPEAAKGDDPKKLLLSELAAIDWNAPNAAVDALQFQCSVSDADGEVAISVIRRLLGGQAADFKGNIGKAYHGGDITLAFCKTFRLYVSEVARAGQVNRVKACRALAEEIVRLASQGSSETSRTEHTPALLGQGPASSNLSAKSVRLVRTEEVLDATPLRSGFASISTSPAATKSKARASKGGAAAAARLKLGERVGSLLSSKGWVVLDGLLQPHEVLEARKELLELEPHFHASEIWVGQQASVGAQLTMTDVRGDKILWMCGHHPQRGKWTQANRSESAEDHSQGEDTSALQPCSATVRSSLQKQDGDAGVRRLKAAERYMHPSLARMLDAMDTLALSLREAPSSDQRRLSGLVERSDAMLAVYPASGARFQAHIDNTAGDGRRLTLLVYLNDADWKESDGGSLRVHPKNEDAVDILPIGGRAALFLADEMEHEVLPTFRPRYSCNVWYYDREERDKALAQAKATGRVAGNNAEGLHASSSDQAKAQAFLSQLLGADGTTTGAPTAAALLADLPKLRSLARELTPGAAAVVGTVVGVPRASSAADIAAVVDNLTEDSLASLRQDLRLMGLKT